MKSCFSQGVGNFPEGEWLRDAAWFYSEDCFSSRCLDDCLIPAEHDSSEA